MKKRPNAIWHMTAWGVGSGFILALSYIVIVFDILSWADGGFNSLGLIFSPFIWFYSFIFGGIPGAIMGIIVGFALWRMMRHVPIPFTKADMIAKRPRVYTVIGGLTMLLSLLLILFFFGGGLFGSFFDFLFLGIPPIIATIAATYAAHRYMFRLRLWSGGIETHKSKAKNDAVAASRLTDNTPNEAISTSDLHEKPKAETHSNREK